MRFRGRMNSCEMKQKHLDRLIVLLVKPKAKTTKLVKDSLTGYPRMCSCDILEDAHHGVFE